MSSRKKTPTAISRAPDIEPAARALFEWAESHGWFRGSFDDLNPISKQEVERAIHRILAAAGTGN